MGCAIGMNKEKCMVGSCTLIRCPHWDFPIMDKRDKLREALEDFRDNGLRCDMIPTHDLDNCEEFWHSYIKRVENSVKERASRALEDK